MFARLYAWMLRMCRHRHAPWYLGGVSFAESSFFPIPPDVMLAPMSLAEPHHAWRFAAITTATSVAGGVLGYLIGVFTLESVMPLIVEYGYEPAYRRAIDWFQAWGFWAVFLAGFTPIPYKVFTISAGAVAMPFLPFVLGSAVGRGMRFFLVAGLVKWAGPRIEPKLLPYIDRIGWATLALVAVVAGIVLMR